MDTTNLKNYSIDKEMTFYSTRDTCVSNSNGGMVFAQQMMGKEKPYYRFASFKCLQDYLDYSKVEERKTWAYHIPPNTPVFEYYDLDCYGTNPFFQNGDGSPLSDHHILNCFIDARKNFQEHLKTTESNGHLYPTLNDNDFYCVRTPIDSKKNKKSFHIYLPNTNIFKNNHQHLKSFVQEFQKFCKEKKHAVDIDMAPYNKNQVLRLLGNHKVGQPNRVAEMYSGDTNSWSLGKIGIFPTGELSDYVATQTKSDSTLYPELDSVVKKAEEQRLKAEERKSNPMPEKNNNEVFEMLNHLSVKRWTEYKDCLSLIWLCKKLGVSDNAIHNLCGKAENYSQDWVDSTIEQYDEDKAKVSIGTLFHYLSEDDPEYIRTSLTKNEKGEEMDYKVIKAERKDRRTKLEQIFYSNETNRRLEEQIDSLFTIEENDFITKEEIDEKVQWVQDITFPSRCVGIHAGLGRGKTTALIRLVKSLPVDARVLILSPRITYAENITAEYNKALDEDRQFYCYTTAKKNMRNMKNISRHKKLVISMESLHYLNISHDSYNKPDLLIVDEANANLFSSVSPETNGKNIDTNIWQFETLLKCSKNVVVADAFLGSKVCQFFTNMCLPLHIFQYKKKLEKRKAIFLTPIHKDVKKEIKKTYKNFQPVLDSMNPSYKLIRDKLKDNKNIYAFCSTRTRLEHWESVFKNDYGIITYSGVSQNDIPQNLNVEWSSKNLVATTSTITVGCNHDRKNIFDNVLIDFSAVSKNIVADAIQGHFRVRNPKGDLYVHVEDNPICPNTPVDIERYREQMNHKIGWYKDRYNGFSNTHKNIQDLIFHNYIEQALSFTASNKMFHRYLKECNYDIVYEDEDEDGDELTFIDEAPEGVDLVKELVDNGITQFQLRELEQLKNQRKLTQDERDKISQFYFIHMFAGGTPSGYRDMKLPVACLAWRIWKAKFGGEQAIKALRLEKQVLEGKVSIKQLVEQRYDDKSQYAEIQKNDLIKIQRVLHVCERLGLKHCNDTDTIIPQERLDEFFNDAWDEYRQIQLDMGIQDKRTKKGKVSQRQFKGCIESVFTKAEHSFCKLKVISQKKITKDGKRVMIREYGLCADAKAIGEDNLEIVNDDINKYDHEKLKVEEIPSKLYDTLDITNKSEEITERKRLLR